MGNLIVGGSAFVDSCMTFSFDVYLEFDPIGPINIDWGGV
tara:strand:- start:551 stop:670 length:120 start_codon:yes stop_codon:yes gene_type:complete